MPARAATVALPDLLGAPSPAARARPLLRRAAPFAAAAALAAVAAVAAHGPAHAVAHALGRAVDADPRWVVAGVGFELASIAGYVLLFWHVAGRATPRIGLRASYEVTLAGAAATRLLPTAGAGGAVLTFWTLRRAGYDSRAAARTLLTFLVILYSVFLGSLLVAGALAASGGHGPLELSLVPAAAAGTAIAIALALALRRGRRPAAESRVHLLGDAVRTALGVVRRPHARLLGAPAWWGFDLLVLWATFHAFGRTPAPEILVLGYFLGQVANTVPVPGAASGGMSGVFLAFGLPVEVVLPAVLAYRAVAIWTPVPAGAAALAGLRRTVARWGADDGDAGEAAAVLVRPARATRPARAIRVHAPRPATVAFADELQRAPPLLAPAA